MGSDFYPPSREARRHAGRLAALLRPEAARLNREFARVLRAKRYGTDAVRAIVAVTPASAAACRSFGRFLEQVEYNGRRLAKLNIAPGDVYDALGEFAALMDPVLAGRRQPAREQLELATRLALNQAYYQVREAETQALFGIYRAEVEARDFGDFLRRMIRVLTAALRARAGRIIEGSRTEPELGKPRYFESGSAGERLIVDDKIRGRCASYWSYPLTPQLTAQFGFRSRYPWLPRELALLETASEICRSAEERLRLASDNLRLEAEARRAEEEERRRIARELHDEAGQSLLLLRLQLEMVERVAPRELREQIGNARTIAESAITEIRRIVTALGPQVLERLGLAAALRHLGARFQKMHPAAVEVRIPKQLPPLSSAAREAIYRVSQECLLNIAKHSCAKTVKLSLRIADSTIRLSVSDDGSGFDGQDAARKPHSYGLAGMRERAALLGGKLETATAPGKGVKVKLELPLAVKPD